MQQNYIKREVFDHIVKYIDNPEMIVITGSRQVGKTVLLLQIKDWLINSRKIPTERIFYFNLDILQDWKIFQNQSDFIEFVKDRSKKHKIYIFVDEAQKAKNANIFFKGVYDSGLNAKFILSGSSSIEIKSKIKESLAGRKIVFTLPPFLFAEFLKANDYYLYESIYKHKQISNVDRENVLRLFKKYIVFGGYPRVVLSSTEEEKYIILNEIHSSYIEKDVLGFLGVKSKLAFNNLMRLLSSQIGQLINIQELAVSLKIDRHTVERYLYSLESTFVVRRIFPFYKYSRQEIIKTPKIYFADTGLRNLLIEDLHPADERIDRGHILENVVFNELSFYFQYSLSKIKFWRTKQKTEVDFIISSGKSLIPVEVKYSIVSSRLPRSLTTFIEKYNPEKAFIINLSHTNKYTVFKKTKIYYIYPFEIFKIRSLFKS